MNGRGFGKNISLGRVASVRKQRIGMSAQPAARATALGLGLPRLHGQFAFKLQRLLPS